MLHRYSEVFRTLLLVADLSLVALSWVAAYYLRFCKSFARMGGTMHYLQCDNVVFMSHVLRVLERGYPGTG